MRGINAVADQLDCACYLECGSEKLENMYSRYGYETVETETLSAKCDRDTDYKPIQLRCMVRPKKSVATKM